MKKLVLVGTPKEVRGILGQVLQANPGISVGRFIELQSTVAGNKKK